LKEIRWITKNMMNLELIFGNWCMIQYKETQLFWKWEILQW
jgi:hypothetical protein